MFTQWLSEILAERQMTALRDVLPTIVSGASSKSITEMIAAILVVFQLMGVVFFDTPMPVIGQDIDLSGYTLVWSDEFTETSLNTEAWEECFPLGTGEIFDKSMMSFDGDNLVLSLDYKEDGPQGAGYYTYGLQNTEAFTKFSCGYYEIRCKAPAAEGMWSAFWMLTEGGRNRTGIPMEQWQEFTEIDVMESFSYGTTFPNTIPCTVHHFVPALVNYESVGVGHFNVGKDIYNEYTTYGVQWTPDEFIFYIDGKEAGRTDNGATEDPAYMLLSIQIRQENGGEDKPAVSENDPSVFPASFVIDYVRAYALKAEDAEPEIT